MSSVYLPPLFTRRVFPLLTSPGRRTMRRRHSVDRLTPRQTRRVAVRRWHDTNTASTFSRTLMRWAMSRERKASMRSLGQQWISCVFRYFFSSFSVVLRGVTRADTQSGGWTRFGRALAPNHSSPARAHTRPPLARRGLASRRVPSTLSRTIKSTGGMVASSLDERTMKEVYR